MAKRKRRTSIRTAAGTAQAAFLGRMRDLRDDPLRVLPQCPQGEPRAIATVRSKLQRIAAGKAGFLIRRDRGIAGAVWQAVQFAELESVPRLMDQRVGGRRRFFLVRGQVERGCLVGVQNHDDPVALLLAYRALAKKAGLHFFAADGLWCTGSSPVPPELWWQQVAKKTGIAWQDHRRKTCPHPASDLVELSFADAAGLAVCADCAHEAGNLHTVLREHYAGPSDRRPVEVHVLRGGIDGERVELERALLAEYRAGVKNEGDVITATLATWRQGQGAGKRWVVGGQTFALQDEFLDAMRPDVWLRPALAAMTQDGHTGASRSVGDVLAEHRGRLVDGVAALLPSGAAKFTAQQQGDPLQVLQAAHTEAKRRHRIGDLPRTTTDSLGTWLDGWARAVRGEGRAAGIARIRRGLSESIPNMHLYACLTALGGDLSLNARFGLEDKREGGKLAPLVAPLLEASGEHYVAALRTYLKESGSGETV